MRLCKSLIFLLTFWGFYPFSIKAQQTNVHQQHALENSSGSINPSYYSSKGNAAWLKKIPTGNYGYEVFGWYPYWDQTYYKEMNYNLVSTVSYFSYSVNPQTGGHVGTYDWDTSPLVDSVKAHKKTILLTASLSGGSSINTLLSSTTNTNALISNLVSENAKRSGNGICIDFEGVIASDKNSFAAFISNLKKSLLAQNSKNKLYLSLPSVDWNKSFLFDSLVVSVDRFVAMCYNYYYSSSSKAGPNSPLNSGSIWAPYNISSTINYYIGASIPASKLILALPFYGLTWNTSSSAVGATPNSYTGNLGYSTIAAKNMSQSVENYSKSTYSIVSNGASTESYEQYWYEADSSFEVKLNYIKSMKLAGLGIWALGFEYPTVDLWKVISSEFSTIDISNLMNKIPSDSIIFDSIHRHQQPDTTSFQKIITVLENKLEPITDYYAVLMYTMSWLVIFGALGLLAGVLFPDTRNYFFSSAGIRNMLVLFVLATLVILLFMKGTLDIGAVSFIVAFASGALVFYLVDRWIQNRKNNLP